jgi:hypothetical protein
MAKKNPARPCCFTSLLKASVPSGNDLLFLHRFSVNINRCPKTTVPGMRMFMVNVAGAGAGGPGV